MNHRGRAGEDRAANFLQTQGLILVARNYGCRFGEIDLIAQDLTTLVFVEVRWRRQASPHSLLETIHPHKQRRLWWTAQNFLAQYPHPPPCRFDIILVTGTQCQNLAWYPAVVLEPC
ncbi:MAG: YraN family protein [Ferrovum sp.]|nr:YraN family protein [Ferrovum sp.]NDU86767.1 YraN family protein [Ferrovum sp.]